MVGHLVTVAAGTQEIDVPPDVPVRVIIYGLGSVDMQFNSDRRQRRLSAAMINPLSYKYLRSKCRYTRPL